MEEVLAKRDCYLVGLRNHAFSDHHDDMDYQVMSDDIIRFADKMGFKTFTLMGHSMGGRCVMTAACLNPDRVDGVITLDAAPFRWYKLPCYLITWPLQTLRMMRRMSKRDFTRKEAMAYIKKKYKKNPSVAAMMMKMMDRKFTKLVWTINFDALLNGQPSYFNKKLRYYKETAYFIRGKNSFDFYISKIYRRVFPNMNKKNIIQVEDAGHFVQYEKPEETAELVVGFL